MEGSSGLDRFAYLANVTVTTSLASEVNTTDRTNDVLLRQELVD